MFTNRGSPEAPKPMLTNRCSESGMRESVHVKCFKMKSFRVKQQTHVLFFKSVFGVGFSIAKVGDLDGFLQGEVPGVGTQGKCNVQVYLKCICIQTLISLLSFCFEIV